MNKNFTEDQKIQQIAEAYSLDAIDFARDNFNIQLDWSDNSVEQIEKMLSIFHEQMAKANPSEEQIFGFAKMFGSYVGETFRRNHGAIWGIVQLENDKFPGLKADGAAGLFWPWGRAQNRITNGPEDNVWQYYKVLLGNNGDNSNPNEPAPSTKKESFWNRLRGA